MGYLTGTLRQARRACRRNGRRPFQLGLLLARQLDLDDPLHARSAKHDRHAHEQVLRLVLALEMHGKAEPASGRAGLLRRSRYRCGRISDPTFPSRLACPGRSGRPLLMAPGPTRRDRAEARAAADARPATVLQNLTRSDKLALKTRACRRLATSPRRAIGVDGSPHSPGLRGRSYSRVGIRAGRGMSRAAARALETLGAFVKLRGNPF